MNILQILPSLDVGGVETGTIDLAKYLAAHGHKAVVVSGGGRLVKELDRVNAKHYSLPVGKKSPLSMVRMVRALVSIIKKEDIEIVHARSRVPALIAYFACRITNRMFITTAHGYYRKHILSEVMGWGRFVIVASNIVAKHMVGDFGVPFERIRLIPRGVDLKRFKFRDPKTHHPKDFTIGMISRITPLKGHADFIKAVSLAVRHIPQLKVIIVGDAPKEKYREDLELLTRRLGLATTIEFLAAQQDISSIMSQMDVLVSSTVVPEAFGRVIIEAQASGVPVVATRVGGVVDIIDDEDNGLLCLPLNPYDMADKILRLYRDRGLWERLALKGRKNVEDNFDLEKMIQRTLAVYEEALKRLNILVIKMSALGDCVLAIPSLRAIRAKFESANIKVLVGIGSREVFDRCPYINDRIVSDFRRKDRGLVGLWRLGGTLRKSCFDIVFDLQNNRKSHILAFLSLAPLRYGYDNGKFSFFLNQRVRDDAPYLDPVEHQFRALKLAGVRPISKDLELWPSESDEAEVKKFLADNWVKEKQDLVGINIRASSAWVTKNWPPSQIAELCDRLAKELNIRTVLTGAKNDASLVSEISKLTKSKPIIAVGRTDVLELANLMRYFKVYVTPDSAPMHIAAAVGTPFVALFGPTDPKRHLPPAAHYAVLYKENELKCVPCYSPNCVKNFKCMRSLSVEEVFDSMRQFLSKPKDRNEAE